MLHCRRASKKKDLKMSEFEVMFIFLILSLRKVSGLVDCGAPVYGLSTDQQCIEIDSVYPPPATTEGSNYTINCKTLLVRTKATMAYCPVGVCQSNGQWTSTSLSCGSSECVDGSSAYFLGKRTCTTSGRMCQRWDSYTPHNHSFTDPTSFPENSTLEAANYCRDPGGTRGTPWCFTTDPNVEWETCGLLNCTDFSMTQGTCPNDYCGDPDMTVGVDDECTIAHLHSYNRSAGSTLKSVCSSILKDTISNISYCPVQRCQTDSFWTGIFRIACGENECYDAGQSDLYDGGRFCTENGWTCQNWDSQSPHSHNYSLPGVGPYCRDPGNVKGQPWCYTSNPQVEWEFCDIPECSSLAANSGTCSPPVVPFPGVEIAGGKYHRINIDVTGYTQQYSLSSNVTTVRCGQHCHQQTDCVFFTIEMDSLCTLFEEDISNTTNIPCSTYKCFEYL